MLFDFGSVAFFCEILVFDHTLLERGVFFSQATLGEG
jgi:hypothetical protein